MHRRRLKLLIVILPISAVAALLIALAMSDRDDVEDLSAWPNGLEATEAPMFAKLVSEGKLPPLSRRLPTKPLVARYDYAGYEGPGPYGGTWRRLRSRPTMYNWKIIGGYASLVRWRADCSGVEPGLAESWEYNDDGTVLTLHLREGLKWSDGHPYTSADFAFYYEMCARKEAGLIPPVWCLVNGKPMTVETPDETTIVMKFAGPNWLVPLWLATGFWVSEAHNIPKHYMTQFHPRYNSRLQTNDFAEFLRKNTSHKNVDRPTMWPWRLKESRDGGYYALLERNPYYYVVDHLGRQLPYIDRVVSKLVPDLQVQVLKMLAGETDCQYRTLQAMDLGLFIKGARDGKYKIKLWQSAAGAKPGILLNWSAPDPVLRKLIRDKRFRRALALAIDRDKCNKIAWLGMCQLQGATISAESWHFNDEEGKKLFEEWKTAFSEYNLDKANALLDEMGLARRDEDGYRLRPDSKRLAMVMDITDVKFSRQENDSGLIVAEGFRKLGIDMLVYCPPGSKKYLRQRLGEYTITTVGQAEMDLFTYPDWVFPTSPLYWHPKVGRWYQTGGAQGEAPTPGDPLDRLLKIYDQIKSEKDQDKRHALVRQAVRIHIDEGPFVLGTVARDPIPVLVGANFHNVPDTGILGPWAVSGPASSYPEQCWMDQEVRK